MSLNNKTVALAAGLILAVSATLTGCGGATDTATKAVDGAAGKVADGAKDVAQAGADVAKAGADVAKAGTDVATKAVDGAKDATGSAMKKVGGAALTPVVTPVKAALVQANSAVKGGDITKAKSQFEKFEGLWKTAEPQIKAAAGDKFPAIESGISKIKTVMGEASPKKEAASEAITGVIKTLDGLTAGK